MQINIEKKHAFMILGAIFMLSGVILVYAFGTNNPPLMGHTPGEIAPGKFGGISANDASNWEFPGKMIISGTVDGIIDLVQIPVGGPDPANNYVNWIWDGTKWWWTGMDGQGNFNIMRAGQNKGLKIENNGLTSIIGGDEILRLKKDPNSNNDWNYITFYDRQGNRDFWMGYDPDMSGGMGGFTILNPTTFAGISIRNDGAVKIQDLAQGGTGGYVCADPFGFLYLSETGC